MLRIEDLDATRCPRSNADGMRRALDALGFDFDGEVLYQSERAEVYAEYFERLNRAGLIYPCFCSRAELHAAEAPHLSDGTPIYAGTCRNLTAAEIEQNMRNGKRPSWRVIVPDQSVGFTDGVCGAVRQNLKIDCGDFIVRRSDGVYAYQLAVVVDDALSGVNEIVRGDDLLLSTPRQLWLADTLGLPRPSHFHIPLLTDADGRRLSKRDGDTLHAAYKTHSPREIVGALAFAAGLIPQPQPMSPHELIPYFDWNKLALKPRMPQGFIGM